LNWNTIFSIDRTGDYPGFFAGFTGNMIGFRCVDRKFVRFWAFSSAWGLKRMTKMDGALVVPPARKIHEAGETPALPSVSSSHFPSLPRDEVSLRPSEKLSPHPLGGGGEGKRRHRREVSWHFS
jgi:hypothetical protein